MIRLGCVVFIALCFFIQGFESTSEPAKKLCKPFKCASNKYCPYGYQKMDGCEICKCNDPCNPPGKAKLCPKNQRCFVDKKPDGTFSTGCAEATKLEKARGKGAKTKIASKSDCNLPKKVGVCKAALPRFYYNSTTKSCEQFIYGSCRGNGNNFKTKAECEALCKA